MEKDVGTKLFSLSLRFSKQKKKEEKEKARKEMNIVQARWY